MQTINGFLLSLNKITKTNIDYFENPIEWKAQRIKPSIAVFNNFPSIKHS